MMFPVMALNNGCPRLPDSIANADTVFGMRPNGPNCHPNNFEPCRISSNEVPPSPSGQQTQQPANHISQRPSSTVATQPSACELGDYQSGSAMRQGRAILTEDQARIIFKYKPSPFAQDRGRAGALARTFGVSVKTIRDIWIGRTWYRATFDLDPCKQEEAPIRLHKKPGRPRGAKDSKPRTKKAALSEALSDPPAGESSGSSSPHDSVSNGEEQQEPTDSDKKAQQKGDSMDVDVVMGNGNDAVTETPSDQKEPASNRTDSDAAPADSKPVSRAKEATAENCSNSFMRWLALPIACSEDCSCDPFHEDWPFWNLNGDLGSRLVQ